MSRKPRHIKTKEGRPPKTKGKPKVIKTDRNAHRPFTLDSPFIFDYESGEYSYELSQKVEAELWHMHDKMVANESCYYNNDFEELIEQLAQNEDNGKLKGKKNAALRGILDKAPMGYPDDSHKYNFMEMLRFNIASKLQIYITRYQLEQVIQEDPKLSPREIRQKYVDKYGSNDAPSVNAIKKHVRAYEKNRSLDNVPTASGLIPLSACDSNYRKLINEYKYIVVVISLSFGKVALMFPKPKNRHRYAGEGRITMPTLRFDDEAHIIHYDFTFTEARPAKKSPSEVDGMLGIDCGLVNTMVMTYVGKDGSYSQPLLESQRIRNIEQQIEALFAEMEQLYEKACSLEKNGWFDKAGCVLHEMDLKREKISRLKKQKSVLAAHEAVSAAISLKAGLAVEDLSWTPESHWDHAFFQKALANLAADVGIPVVKVRAAGTSKHCPHCGSELKERTGRKLYCPECKIELDRDIVGSRNIGARGLRYDVGALKHFKYKLANLNGDVDRSHRDDRARRYKCNIPHCSRRPCNILDVYDTIFASPLCLPPGE